MALNICIASLWEALFLLLKYCIDNFIFVLLVLAFLGFVKKMFGNLLALGSLAFVINLAIDFLVVGTGGLTTPLTILGGLAIGALWAMMAFTSEVSILIRIPNAILMFIVGLIWGWAPIPFPIPLAPLIGLALQKFTLFNYLVGLFSFLLITLPFLITTGITAGFAFIICQGLQMIINLL